MRLVPIFFLISACFLWQCNQVDVPIGYVPATIELRHSEGSIHLSLPPEFDTLYTFLGLSDCICCGYHHTRYSNSTYALLTPSNFLDTLATPDDSLYYFNVSQPRDVRCEEDVNQVNEEMLQLIEDREKAINPGNPFTSLEIRKIKGYSFIVLIKEANVWGKERVSLTASTIIDGHWIECSFHCHARDCSGFMDRMDSSLQSIQVIR